MTAKDRYLEFLDALNRQDLEAAARCVDTSAYVEDCVGFTGGFVGWDEAVASVGRVWRGIPDLRAVPHQVVAEDGVVLARLTVSGTNSGWLFGAPPTGRAYEASMFDSVEIDDAGLIVRRVQQADALGQFRQLFGPALVVAGAVAAGSFAALGGALLRAHRRRDG
jgi:predicted ester cyclase